jgi:SPP1 family predicted phage head-tail adaptor
LKCCDLTPGDLDRKVEFLEIVKAPDGAGGFTKPAPTSLVPPLTTWAKIRPASGRELVYAARIDAKGYDYVYVRYNERITELLIMRYKDRDYNVRSVIDMGARHEWMEIVVERGVANS